MNIDAEKPVRPTKRLLIEQTLRRDIIEGRVRPGGRMPSWIEFARRFGTGPLTIQQAVDRLTHDGFIVPRGSRGTFAAEHLPHLTRYALVFLNHPSYSRFLTALWKEAANVGRDTNRKIEVFDEVSDHSDSESYQRLLSAVQGERLAGVIFAHLPVELMNSPLMRAYPELSRVAVTKPGVMPGLGAIELDGYSYMDAVLDHFAARGRRRLATLAGSFYSDRFTDYFTRGAAARGMILRPHWQQLPAMGNPMAIRLCLQLLLNEQQTERPDAILLADDNLVEHATAALRDMNLKIPQDVDVVAHCNFPWAAPNLVPVKWIGFDAREILESAVQIIDRQRLDGNKASSCSIRAIMRDDPTASTE